MATPTRWSDEFLVNTLTAFDQGEPSVATLADGRIAFVYRDRSQTSEHNGTDSSGDALRVQIHAADGSLLLGPIQINTVTTGDQTAPMIVALAGGGFAVVYADASGGVDSGSDDTTDAVRMQIFGASGLPVGDEILVNGVTDFEQFAPDITQLDTGEIVVSYSDNSGALSDADTGVVAALFGTDGSRIVPDFQVNLTTADTQDAAKVAALAGGDRFVAVYQSGSGSAGDIMGRIFDRTGAVVLEEFTVNATTTGSQIAPEVTGLATGGFIVTWSDGSGAGSDSSFYGIRAQVFDRYGTALGDEIEVNTATTGLQFQSEVLGLSDGRFVVAWVDLSAGVDTGNDDTSSSAIRAQLFRPNGAKDGDEFLVNTVTTNSQADLTMAETPDGRLVISYLETSFGVETGSDDTTAAVRATVFELRDAGEDWTGDSGANSFAGTQWADRLIGVDGNDTLYGVGGADRLGGGAGADRLFGGDGQDRVWGANGNDEIYGGADNDRLWGGRGADLIEGGDGRDRLVGGKHGDQLVGGADRDILKGGAGYDSFVFLDDSDSLAGRSTRDRILDFDTRRDVIDLSAIDAAPLTIPEDDFTWIGRAQFSGTVGELRYWTARKMTVVQADLDGDGRADMAIELRGRMSLGADDFSL